MANARDAADELLAWQDTPEGDAWVAAQTGTDAIGLVKFTMQLSSALRVVVPSDPVPSLG